MVDFPTERPQKAVLISQKTFMAQHAKKNPIIRYFRGSWEELKKVSWPTRAEAWRKAWIVVLVSLFFAVFLGGLDYLLNRLIDLLVS
jgi:preprotein translocase subunit SecE